MKTILSKSYVKADFLNLKMDRQRLQSRQNNPQIATFQTAFKTLNLVGITALSEADAVVLTDIQDQIRKKLRFFGVQPGF